VDAERLYELASITRRDRRLIAAFRGSDMAEVPDKLAALLAIARALDDAGVPHALIGGIAVGVHSGVPRATLDTDLAVVSTADREVLARALEKAGFTRTGAFAHSLNLRHPSGEPIQLAFDPMFDPMIARADHIEVGGTSLPIVRKDDLIAMKERAAADPARRVSKRLRDRADVALLKGDVPEPDEGW
jgi:predicted nucleotidyltransferase